MNKEPKSLIGELWREYDFGGRVVRIEKPHKDTAKVLVEDESQYVRRNNA